MKRLFILAWLIGPLPWSVSADPPGEEPFHRDGGNAEGRLLVDRNRQGPGFEYGIPLQLTITTSENGENIGYEPLILATGKRGWPIESLTPETFDKYLRGEKDSVVYLLIAPPKGKRGEQKIIELKRTVARNGFFYPAMEFARSGKVVVKEVHPGSAAAKAGTPIVPQAVIVAAGKDPAHLTPLSGPQAWALADQALLGRTGDKFFVKVQAPPTHGRGESPAVSGPVALSHFPVVEFLPRPPYDHTKEVVLPAIADDRGCRPDLEQKLIQEVTREMSRLDMARKELGDELSSEFHDRLFDDLDRDHSLFTAEDRQEFEGRRRSHDDAFKQGSLTFAYDLQARVIRRLHERVEWTQKVIEGPLDPNQVEVYAVNRARAAFPAAAEAEALWGKKVRREIWQAVAGGLSLEEAKNRVKEKYQRQLTRHERRCQGRIVANALNVLGHCFGRYTRFFTPDESKHFQEAVAGDICGIGVGLRIGGERVLLDEVHEGSPAARAGLKVGDEVMAAGRSDTEMVDVEQFGIERVLDRFSGECDEEILLTVKRNGQVLPQRFAMRRAPFDEKELRATGEMYEIGQGEGKRKIAHLTLPTFYGGGFGTGSASEDVVKLLQGKLKGAQVLVLDLRGNGGGLLHEAMEVIGAFAGDVPGVQTWAPGAEPEIGRPGEQKKASFKGQLIVLVDEDTASAAEIVAAALQDHRRAVVVGNARTYGKAQVQRVFSLGMEKDGEELPRGAFKASVSAYYQITGHLPAGDGVRASIVRPSMPAMPSEERESQFAAVSMPSPPSVFQKGVRPAGKLTPQEISELQRRAKERLDKSKPLQDLMAIETSEGALEGESATQFSLPILQAEAKRRKEFQERLARDIPRGPDQYARFPTSVFGAEINQIALDLYRITKGRPGL